MRALFLSRYSEMAIQFAASLVVARLLRPDQLGVSAVAGSLVATIISFRTFGANTYIVQEPDLTPVRLGSAALLGYVGCSLFAGLVLLLANPAAYFYGDARIAEVLWFVAINFLLVPVSLPAQALFTRELKMHVIAATQIIGALVGAAVTIFVAAGGGGHVAPVVGSCASAAAIAVAFAFIAPARVFLRPAIAEWRRVARIGALTSFAGVFSELGMQFPQLVIGKFAGMRDSGLYSRGTTLVTIFREGIQAAAWPIALPLFAGCARDQAELRRTYLKVLELFTGLSWPFYSSLTLLAFPAMRILYGETWDAAVPVSRLLAVAGALFAFSAMAQPALLGSGKAKENLHAEIAIQTFRIVLALAAAPFGLLAVVGSQIAVQLWAGVIRFRQVSRLAGITLEDVAKAVAKSALLAGATAVIPLLALLIFGEMKLCRIVVFAPVAAATGLAWLISAAVLRHSAWEEILRAVPFAQSTRAMFARVR